MVNVMDIIFKIGMYNALAVAKEIVYKEKWYILTLGSNQGDLRVIYHILKNADNKNIDSFEEREPRLRITKPVKN